MRKIRTIRQKLSLPPVRLSFMAVGLSVFLFTAAVSAVMFFEFPAAIGAEKELPIYSVERRDKAVALTFDCAWGDEHMEAILDTLDQHGAKATFFVVNYWAEKYPDMVKELASRGHEIGSHSTTHPDLATLPKETIQKEIGTVEETVEKLTGRKTALLRPPFGSYNNTVMDAANAMGYQVIQWSLDSLDWKSLTAEQIVDRVTRNVRPGAIVLFHNNAEHAEEYLPLILDKLQSEGYEILPVGQLIYAKDYHMDRTGRQIYDGTEEPEGHGGGLEEPRGEAGVTGPGAVGESMEKDSETKVR
ncbi:polysaccharide deacetylase family protein [Bacilliculturomica massiliensis]|uniref:polysaccharide deacetylase family protein n=1 Tax=Bacilliculturomica massiliensis TaxID=1917867 RepID=UPI001030CFCB|nr:polysaccharide deacetylase family protein [Bacilliculturomica massiliensis]